MTKSDSNLLDHLTPRGLTGTIGRRVVGCISALIVVVVGFAIVLWLAKLGGANLGLGNQTIIWANGPSITQIEKMSEIVAMRVSIANVLIAEGEGYRGSWLIKGDALLTVDVSKAKLLDRNDVTKRALISLPEPHVLSARVDHSKSMTWDVKKTTWVPFGGDPDKLRDEAMRRGQEMVEHDAAQPEYMTQAKQHAEGVIKGVYRLVGWEVAAEWRANE